MKVKINCNRLSMWYRDKLGEVFEFDREETDSGGDKIYWVRDNQGYLNFIYAKDCDLSFEQPKIADPSLILKQTNSKLSNPKDVIGVRKAPMSCLPANVLAEAGVALSEGTAKYGRHNYREVGVRASVYYDAAFRHLMAWWEGQDIDPDSGMNHVIKCITALIVLRDSMQRGNWTDDRPPKSEDFYPELNRLVGEILDRHADKHPKHVTELNKVIDQNGDF